MESGNLHPASSLPVAYASWRCRMLVGSLLATALGLFLHGPMLGLRFDFGEELPSPWVLLGVVAVIVSAFGPGLAGACFGIAAVWFWRNLGRSSRLARTGWILWVLGPLPILLVPLANFFHLDEVDSLKTSTSQIKYLLTVTAPAFFALLPGTLSSALVLKQFLPESRAPGQITLLAAPACTVAYLLPLGVLTQLAFHSGLYLGLFLLALSPLVPLVGVGWLLRRDTPERAGPRVRGLILAKTALSLVGVILVIRWVGEHPALVDLLGQMEHLWVWVLGMAVKVVASKWLTTVVVSDLIMTMLYQSRVSALSLSGTKEGEVLAQKLDSLGASLRRVQARKVEAREEDLTKNQITHP